MKILCSSNMPFAKEAFSTLGDVIVKDGRAITAQDARDTGVLAIRSTTKVNRSLLEGSAVEFVGTATIGTDHIDVPYLEEKGIKWCYSPGCNANSVSEYVVSALLCLAVRHGFKLEEKTMGVVGVGNVGSLVAEKTMALGMKVLLNDPPRERDEGGDLSRPEGGGLTDVGNVAERRGKPEERTFVGLDQLLEQADIVTMHVPLEKEGSDPTWHMAADGFFSRLKPGCIFINSSRGAVVETDALLKAIREDIVKHTVIDTWEGEPGVRKDLLDLVDIGTPHIAGYSYDGKVMGTVMVYREACSFLGVDAAWSPDDLLPDPTLPEINIDVRGRSDEEVMREIVNSVYDITSDDRMLKEGAGAECKASHFDALRSGYSVRREFRFTTVTLENASATLAEKVSNLGFPVIPKES